MPGAWTADTGLPAGSLWEKQIGVQIIGIDVEVSDVCVVQDLLLASVP